jgi:hypothetical protein
MAPILDGCEDLRREDKRRATRKKALIRLGHFPPSHRPKTTLILGLGPLIIINSYYTVVSPRHLVSFFSFSASNTERRAKWRAATPFGP